MESAFTYQPLGGTHTSAIGFPLRTAAGLTGLLLAGAVGLGALYSQSAGTPNSGTSTMTKSAFVPQEGTEKVLVRSGPGPLQLFPSVFGGKKETTALFLYGDTTNIPQELIAGSSESEGWVYGAKFYADQESGLPNVAIPTGNSGDVVKGRLFKWPTGNVVKERLALADKSYGVLNEETLRRRGEVCVIQEDGTSFKAHWFFQERPFAAPSTRSAMNSAMKFMWYGTNSWLWEVSGKRILVDPWLCQNLEFFSGATWFFSGQRTRGDPALPEDLDMILLSQGIADHCHPETMRRLAKLYPSLLVLGSRAAAKVSKDVGFTNVKAVSPGDFFTFGDIHFVVTEGALTGPTPENGYILSAPGSGSIYYEPHGAFPASLAQHGRVDVVVAPTNDIGIKKTGPFVMGGKNGLKLAKVFRPKFWFQTAAGDDGVDAKGILPEYFLYMKGGQDALQQQLKEAGLSTKVLAPTAMDVVDITI
eukprot:gb/GEZN01007399.1/.p1 GENE.gb/GEZN01007399.1/~~gb/GEZN01007399.1/.p1  ORF type:complete len:475 (-),score=69.70 gb/GEZN01007399.1/:67-1491(-)